MKNINNNIRIVIPAFNAGNTIIRCLDAVLESLSFTNSWEIIIVDNGQNPDFKILLKDYSVKILKRDNIHSAAFARNEGALGFDNGILIFIDSDVICQKNCIKELIEPVQIGFCNASIGNYSKNITGLSFTQKYKQLYINKIYDKDNSNIKNDFWTAICSVDAEVFHNLNGFNSNFKGANGEDQEFGIRLTRNGYQVKSVITANGQHLNPYGLFKIIQNDFKKGFTAIQNSFVNKVPISDNRHAQTTDILAVFFSVAFIVLVVFGTMNFSILQFSIFIFILWFISRISLLYNFLKLGGFFFFIRAVFLAYILDLIRFLTVFVYSLKHIFLKINNK